MLLKPTPLKKLIWESTMLSTETERLIEEAFKNPKPSPPKEFRIVEPQYEPLAKYYHTVESSLKKGVLFKDFNTNGHVKYPSILNTVIDSANNTAELKNGIGYYFWSNTPGSGKTLLACALANELYKRNKRTHSQIISLHELLDKIREVFRPFSTTSIETVYNPICSVPLLILDDLGKERHVKKGEEGVSFAEEQIDKIVNLRMSKPLPTIFTSNNKPSELPYHPRLISRIVGISIVKEFPSVDMRAITKIMRRNK